MTVEPITLLHGAMVALLATSTLGSFAASYVFWVVKCAAPEGFAAQPLSTQR
jgi:hypothetical protein